MTHTEKYELPIIEGTDVVDYAPFNEGMEKIEGVLENNETLVQEAVDDVAEMGDTLNQKVQEVDEALAQTESDVNAALEQTESNVNASLEQTTDELTGMVNSKLGRISKFALACKYNIPDDTYLFGSESGMLNFPLTSVTPTMRRDDTIITVFADNRFNIKYEGLSTPLYKIDIEFDIEPNVYDNTFNGGKQAIIEMWRGGPVPESSNIVASTEINCSTRNHVHLTALTGPIGGGNGFFVRLNSSYTCKLVGNATLTVEDVGLE